MGELQLDLTALHTGDVTSAADVFLKVAKSYREVVGGEPLRLYWRAVSRAFQSEAGARAVGAVGALWRVQADLSECPQSLLEALLTRLSEIFDRTTGESTREVLMGLGAPVVLELEARAALEAEVEAAVEVVGN